jgi:S-adenosylmethionine:tRNA ribosyltransferase-isomerase
MIVDRASGEIRHGTFGDIAELVAPGDVLVVNRTRVFRARLLGTRASGAPAEILLLKSLGDSRYEAMVSPGGKLKPGRVVHVAPGFSVEILEVTNRRTRIVRLESDLPLDDAIERYGHIPLPPYIERPDAPEDADRYQTVFARERGSVAAPAHVMHEEWYSVSPDAARTINDRRAAGGRVWAVGTTSVRTLESAANADGTIRAGEAETRIFIRPSYEFRAVDRIVTNFHLPRSTLIMLVAAFAGYELTMRAYRAAVDAGYRFYSYGDAMVVL